VIENCAFPVPPGTTRSMFWTEIADVLDAVLDVTKNRLYMSRPPTIVIAISIMVVINGLIALIFLIVFMAPR